MEKQKKVQQKGTDEWRFDANLGSLASSKLGVGGSFSRNKNTRDWELSIGVGPYTGTWSKTNNNINYSYSLGADKFNPGIAVGVVKISH